MAAYIEGLKDLTPTEIENGCERCLKEVDHMPTVAHIRERIHEYRDPRTADDGKRGCETCQFTGWKMVDRKEGQGKIAVRCECTKEKKNDETEARSNPTE